MPGDSGICIGGGDAGGAAPIDGAPCGGICGICICGRPCGICGICVCGGGLAIFISARVMASRWSVTPVF
jgi:hypothetical protein